MVIARKKKEKWDPKTKGKLKDPLPNASVDCVWILIGTTQLKKKKKSPKHPETTEEI